MKLCWVGSPIATLIVNYGFLSAFKGDKNKMLAIGATLLQVKLLNLIPDSRKVSFYSIADYKTNHPDWDQKDLAALLNLFGERANQTYSCQEPALN